MFKKVAQKSELADQSAKCVEVEGKRIALFNLGGEVQDRRHTPASTLRHPGPA